MPISAYIRRLIERENDAAQLDNIRRELLNRLDALAVWRAQPTVGIDEILLLCRAVAAHLSPPLVAQVRAKLAQQS